MSKIAIIGIAGESVFLSVDSFGVIGETVQAKSYYNELGGKGFNQAIAVSRYGEKVSFLCSCYQADEERFTVTISKKVKLEGEKRPKLVDEDVAFAYDEIKYTKYLINFK